MMHKMHHVMYGIIYIKHHSYQFSLYMSLGYIHMYVRSIGIVFYTTTFCMYMHNIGSLRVVHHLQDRAPQL